MPARLAGRTTDSVFYTAQGEMNLVERWRTSTAYEGDLTKTIPPAGGVPTTTVVDIDGHAVALRQHTTAAGVGGPYVETRYEYDRRDKLVKVIDTKGNQWAYTFDLKGRQIRTTDPDKGTNTSEYNDYDELVTTTDARGETCGMATTASAARSRCAMTRPPVRCVPNLSTTLF